MMSYEPFVLLKRRVTSAEGPILIEPLLRYCQFYVCFGRVNIVMVCMRNVQTGID